MPIVLAFSPDGNFEETDDMPLCVIQWMNDTKEMVDAVRSGEIEPLASPIRPLLETEWNQDGAFNDQVPLSCGNDEAPAGCVAIAIAQVMYHHNYPDEFDWNAMDLTVGTTESARLIADIGQKIGMNYDCAGSGAKTKDIPNLLKTNYNYSSATYSSNINLTTMQSNISGGKPVILSGFSDTVDHAWVCDGYISTNMCTYTTIRFHMNWGWGGSNDGWFILENLNPKGGKGYYKDKAMVYNINK